MKSKIENCLYMQVAHCNKCGGQSGYNIVDGEKVCFDCGEPYKADFKIFTGTWVSIFIIGLVIVWIDENK